MKRKISEMETYLRNLGKDRGRERTREMVRVRDKHTCRSCGLVVLSVEIKRFNENIKGLAGRKKCLDVHHLNGKCGKKSTGYDSTRNLRGLIALCHACHLRLDSVRKKMREHSSPRPNKK